jgi:hypothetical protein
MPCDISAVYDQMADIQADRQVEGLHQIRQQLEIIVQCLHADLSRVDVCDMEQFRQGPAVLGDPSGRVVDGRIAPPVSVEMEDPGKRSTGDMSLMTSRHLPTEGMRSGS